MGGAGLIFFFKTGLLCVALVVLEFTMQARLALNSRDPPATASQVLGIEAGTANPTPNFVLCF